MSSARQTAADAEGPVLYVGIVLYSTQDPEAQAMLVADGLIAWIGPEDTARRIHPEAQLVHAEGSLITPGFVDSAPTADGTEPDRAWYERAARRGVTDAVPGPVGRRDGIEVIAPVDTAAPYLTLTSDGIPIAFGSAGQQQAQDPWSWVRAAALEGPTEQRISVRAAFLAASRAGHRLAGRMHPGSLNPGTEATFVVWEPWDLTVHGQDERIQTWSTDPRSRTPMLPDLTEGAPEVLRTVVSGHLVHDRLASR